MCSDKRPTENQTDASITDASVAPSPQNPAKNKNNNRIKLPDNIHYDNDRVNLVGRSLGRRTILSHVMVTAFTFVTTYLVSYTGFATAIDDHPLYVPQRQVNVTDFHLSTSLDYGIARYEDTRSEATSSEIDRHCRNESPCVSMSLHESALHPYLATLF